ncbi:TRAP transporter large permease [uncultured Oscillibacter sp.]|uniref:TRAP transporter large permease n=1 Tax=uncultured Oscillibacter sp. TaxID=876091 RepID=UPI002805DEC9|nr:TRAP transporter large permease [uncultured Oscillibacter sp.]
MHVTVALILTVGLVIFLALGIPIGMSLCTIGCIGFMVSSGSILSWLQLISMPMKLANSLQNFLLLSIPLFILAAKIMNGSSITNRIFSFANTIVGWLPGGLGHANIVASLIFAGMSGTAVSDAAGLGQIEIEAMTSNGYDREFSAGVTAASSTIAPIFPPSVPMVMYATVSGASVGALFIGGVIPGLLMTFSMMAIVYVVALKRHYPRSAFPTLKGLLSSFWKALIPMMTPVILLVGIWSGVFTTTEAAVVATLYALVVSFLVFREMTFGHLWQILKETARETASIAFVTASAAFYGWVLAKCGVTNAVATWLSNLTDSPVVFMLIINVALLVIGCFMESIAAILVFGPVLMQAVTALAIDPVYFGVIMVLNLMIGLLTPPFGVCLFVTADVAKISFKDMLKGVSPFYIPLFGTLILITLFPGLITWLPSLLG